VEPFKVMVSRDRRERVMGVKRTYSNATYKPKYDQVEKHSTFSLDFKKLIARDKTPNARSK